MWVKVANSDYNQHHKTAIFFLDHVRNDYVMRPRSYSMGLRKTKKLMFNVNIGPT